MLSVRGYFDDTQHMQMSLPGSPGTLEAQMGLCGLLLGLRRSREREGWEECNVDWVFFG